MKTFRDRAKGTCASCGSAAFCALCRNCAADCRASLFPILLETKVDYYMVTYAYG